MKVVQRSLQIAQGGKNTDTPADVCGGGDTQETAKDSFPRAGNWCSPLDLRGGTALDLLGIWSLWSETQHGIAGTCQGHEKGDGQPGAAPGRWHEWEETGWVTGGALMQVLRCSNTRG